MNIPEVLKVPKDLEPKRLKRIKRQRAKRGWSDWDFIDGDSYLLAIIACMADHYIESPTYPGFFYDFDTGDIIHSPAPSLWKAQLEKVGTACRALLAEECGEFLANGKIEAVEALRMKVFTWLGHNLGLLWD